MRSTVPEPVLFSTWIWRKRWSVFSSNLHVIHVVGVIDTFEDSALQLREAGGMDPMTFHQDKCVFLHLATGWAGEWLPGKGPAHCDTWASMSGFTASDKCQQHARLDEQKQSQWVANTQYSIGHNFGYTPSSFGSPNTLSKLNLIWWKARKMRGLEHVRRGWEKWLCTAWTSESSGEAYLTRWYLRGYQERMSRPFTGVHGRRNRDSCHSLKQVGFWFGTCK